MSELSQINMQIHNALHYQAREKELLVVRSVTSFMVDIALK